MKASRLFDWPKSKESKIAKIPNLRSTAVQGGNHTGRLMDNLKEGHGQIALFIHMGIIREVEKGG